jgi:RHS repeat-associated protein
MDYMPPDDGPSQICETCCSNDLTGASTDGITGGPTGNSRDGQQTIHQSPGVVMSSGQLKLDMSLMTVKALGIGSWGFGLHYLSNAGIDTAVGIGFNFTQNTVLTQLGDGSIRLLSCQNVSETFTPLLGGGYSSFNNNTAATLTRSNIGASNEFFTLTSRDGTVTIYSGINSLIPVPGQVLSVTDRYGNTQSWSWIITGGVAQMASATDSYGRTATYSYFGSEFGFRLSQIQDYQGRKLNFQYDAAGHLLAVVLPSITQAADGNTFPGGTAYVFEYDTSNARPQRQDDLIKIWYPNETLPFIDTGTRTVNVTTVYASAKPRYVMTYGQDPTDTDLWGRVLSVTAGDPINGVGGTANYLYNSNSADLPTNVTNLSDPIVFRGIGTDRNGNQTIYDFNAKGMPVRTEVMPTRNKLTINDLSFPANSWVTWKVFNGHNQPLAIIFPEGNSVQYTYEDGNVPGIGFYAPRVGLKLTETHLPSNNYGIAENRPTSGDQFHTTRYFYDPIYNQLCAAIEPRGNPINTSGGSNVYFTPQNGSATPTDADRSAYVMTTFFDYQKNQTSTITGNAALQALLGLDATAIGNLITFVNNQMTATDGTGGIPTGFQTNLGDINGDGTGDGASSGLDPTPMLCRTVKLLFPPTTVIGSTTITTQTRLALYTNNFKGQATTETDAEGNVKVYVRYPENDPNGDGTINNALSGQQYGMLREVHVDADPNDVMDMVGASGDLVDFVPGLITRTNTPNVYQDLTTRFEGSGSGGGCSSCAYDEYGNPTAMTDPRGFTTVTQRNEIGEIYRTISPEPYNYTVEMYFDANRNIIRTDTQDQQVKFDSMDPSSAGYGHFTFSGSGTTAQVPMIPGPGGTLRLGWFTNLAQYNILDWKTQDDIDATGSNPSNLITTYTYDPNGNLIKITKPMGNTVEYDYDERNLKIAQRVGYDTANPDNAAITILYYDNNGMLGSVIGPAVRGTADNSLMATILDAFFSGSPLVHTGDWVVQNVYDGFDRVTQAIDAVGGTANTTYDPGNRLIQAQMQGTIGGSTPADRTGSSNQILSNAVTRFDESGRQYEKQNDVFISTGVTLPSGRSVAHTGGGLATNSTANDHTGTATLTSGDSSYVLSRAVFDAASRVVQMIMDNTAITTVAYDGANRQILTTDPFSNTAASQYDGNGNLVQSTRIDVCTITTPTTSNETFVSFVFYDSLNRPVISGTQGADGVLTTNLTVCCTWPVLPSTLFSQFGYDSRNNRVVSIDPKLNSALTAFDGTSRAIESQQLLRQNGHGSHGPDANATFQSAGRGSVRTQMLYDGNSRIFQLIDDRGNETLYTFDLLDRQVTMEFNDGSTRTNVYDTASDVVTYTDENGSVFANTFDCSGRKTAVAIALATGVGGTTNQGFQYDGLNRVTQAIDSAVINELRFDSLGRMLEDNQFYLIFSRSVTHTAFISLPVQQLTYPDGRQTSNTYDALYRRTDVRDTGAGSAIATWQFYGPSRVAEVALGNGLSCTFMNNPRTNSAAQASGPANPAWGDNSSDRLGYDGAGRNITKRYLSSALNEDGSYSNTTSVVGFTTTFDRASNKAYERHLHAESRSHLYLPIAVNGVEVFGYDSLDRLRQYQRGVLSSTGGIGGNGGGSITTPITLPGTDQIRNYTLDGLSNWKNSLYTTVESGGGTLSVSDVRQHNDVNQITRITTNGTPQPVAYDHGNNTDGRKGNGNLANDGIRSYQYDALNRLIQVNRVSDNAMIAFYVYDAVNRRIYKQVTDGGIPNNSSLNGTTVYSWDGQRIIEELDGTTHTPTKQYAWGIYIDELLQQRAISGDTNTDYYLLSDLLYRSVALTDSNGSIVEAYDTDAYGNTLCFSAAGTGGNWFADDATVTDNPMNTYIFTGREFDAETQIYCYRTRYLAPSFGRFLQEDSLGYIDELNLYQYTNSNPINKCDPAGTRWVLVWNPPMWIWIPDPVPPAPPTTQPAPPTTQPMPHETPGQGAYDAPISSGARAAGGYLLPPGVGELAGAAELAPEIGGLMLGNWRKQRELDDATHGVDPKNDEFYRALCKAENKEKLTPAEIKMLNDFFNGGKAPKRPNQ